jgi:hypothetical protein
VKEEGILKLGRAKGDDILVRRQRVFNFCGVDGSNKKSICVCVCVCGWAVVWWAGWRVGGVCLEFSKE